MKKYEIKWFRRAAIKFRNNTNIMYKFTYLDFWSFENMIDSLHLKKTQNRKT